MLLNGIYQPSNTTELPTVTAAACATQLLTTQIAAVMNLGVAVIVTVFAIVVAVSGVVVADVVTIVYRSMLLSVVVVAAAVAHWAGVTARPVAVAAEVWAIHPVDGTTGVV